MKSIELLKVKNLAITILFSYLIYQGSRELFIESKRTNTLLEGFDLFIASLLFILGILLSLTTGKTISSYLQKKAPINGLNLLVQILMIIYIVIKLIGYYKRF